jgi:hypothetical protein
VRQIEAQLLDLRFRLRPQPPPSDDIVLVLIDDRSIREIGRWPWSRGIMADALTWLDAAGARTIGFDLLFAEPEPAAVPAAWLDRLRDGSVLTCGEATGLTLDRALYAPEQDSRNFLVRVSFGIVRAVVELLVPPSTFEMHTNTAVISARGTAWIAEARREATAIVALDGEVAVGNVELAVPGTAVLRPGEGVTVEVGAPPPAPTVWGDARRNAFIERTTLP